MKTISMTGGLHWQSTVEDYTTLCTKTNERYRAKGATPPDLTPHMIIESLDVGKPPGCKLNCPARNNSRTVAERYERFWGEDLGVLPGELNQPSVSIAAHVGLQR